MTVRTIASNSRTDFEDGDAISPMQHGVNGLYRIVMEPQPVHTKGNPQTLANDGVAVTDYFFGQQSLTKQEETQIGERRKPRRKASFGAWCRGYDRIEV
jgi:hypothetical protein